MSIRVFPVTNSGGPPNVVATGSGEFDLTGLTLFGPAFQEGDIFPGIGAITLSSAFTTNDDLYLGPIFGLNTFGPGYVTSASSNNNGPPVTFVPGAKGELIVPHGYTSGTLLASSQDIFNNTTLAGLGIVPGTYSWTWGSGNIELDQSFTIHAIAPTPTAVTPLPATLPLFAAGLGALGLLGWLRKRKSRAAVA
jgi:hypothetical protein